LRIYRNSQCHKGDTFRELLEMWRESGYCEVIESEDRFCWANEIGDILLYEYARFDFMPERWNHALFSNMQMDCENCTPWIFWARHPRKLEREIQIGIKPYDKREIESVFLGKVENNIQLKSRVQHDWSSCIESFSMPILIGDSQSYPYTQEEYLRTVKSSKFGLVLPGYGPKCNREIEYLGLGTVPIYADGCSLDFYNSMKEGVHYLRASSPEEVKDIVDNTSKNEWEILSKTGREWYDTNCSRKGSFNTTQRILEDIKHG